MATLESQIDDLYKGQLDEFTSKRNALAKSHAGDERKTIAGLQKPTAAAWAVNQAYWRARPAYDELLARGKRLRAAQVAALKGRNADVREATAEHREAVSKVVTAATRLAAASGLSPSTSDLQRMVEAISLQETLPEPHGRFVKPIQLAGFEALTGIPIAPPAATSRARPRSADDRTEQRAREKAEAERREQEKAVKKAEARVERAAAEEQRARAEWERARRALDEAKRALEQLATGS